MFLKSAVLAYLVKAIDTEAARKFFENSFNDCAAKPDMCINCSSLFSMMIFLRKK